MDPAIIAVIYVLVAFIAGVVIGWCLFRKERAPAIEMNSSARGYAAGHMNGRAQGYREGRDDGYKNCYDTKVAVRLSNGRFSKPGS